MAPPRPTPVGQEEELFTTVAPTIKEEHEDTDEVTTAAPDFDVDDFVRENVTYVESIPHRGDTFPEPQSTAETIDSVSAPIEEPDDHSVIEISTVQPDVPIPDASLSTESMFAEGKTEKTILDSGITTEMTFDQNDTESTELTSEEVLRSSESTPSPAGTHSATPFTDYDSNIAEIETFPVEGLPPMQPTSSSDSTTITDKTVIPTDTTFIFNTRPRSEADITTTAPPETTRTAAQTTPQTQDVETPAVVYKEETASVAVTANPVLIDSGTSAEDVTSSTSVHVFDESSTQVPEHSGDSLTEDDTTTDIGTEFFTSAPVVSAVAGRTTTPGTVVADEVTTVMQKQNESDDQGVQPQYSQSPVIPVVPDHPTPSIVDGEPILQSGDPDDLFSPAAVTITPTVSFINGKHEITLEPLSPEEKEAKGTQILTNVTTLGASDEITTVFDHRLTDLPDYSSTESTEEPLSPTAILTSTEVPDVDDYDTVNTIVESTPPDIFPEELTTKGPTQKDTTFASASTVEETASLKTTQKTETGSAATDATEGMSDVTGTSADFVPTVSPAKAHITEATEETGTTMAEKETTNVITTSIQKEVGESRTTPTYVKSDSEVTQTEKAEDQTPFTPTSELHTDRDDAEITEDTKSTSASPAAEDATQSTSQTVYTPSSDDTDAKTSTTSDSQSSTQDMEGGKETQTPKEFASSSISPEFSSSAFPEQTAKTEITPSIDAGSIESSSTVASTLAESSEGTVTSQGGSMVKMAQVMQPLTRSLRRPLL
ncbi:uncharacterized protein [Thunnus thynnus]|uniref:uncharacterized protein n=1 Tax=Thunnus thynnus TaxID=8237 RepID=UPI0035283D86